MSFLTRLLVRLWSKVEILGTELVGNSGGESTVSIAAVLENLVEACAFGVVAEFDSVEKCHGVDEVWVPLG